MAARMVKGSTSINEMEDSMTKNVTVEINEGICVLKLSRLESLNALNTELVKDLDDFLEAIRKNSKVRVLIVVGDEHFAAGADIKDMLECDEEQAADFSFASTFQKLYELEIPTIAAIEGYALGGGLELALTCDLRVVSRKAKMGFPETGLGIMPGAGGTVITPRLIGESKALELILMGTILDGEEAYRIGLVNKIVEPGQAFNEAMLWANKLVKGAPLALKTAKKTIRDSLKSGNYQDGLQIELKNWSKLFATGDQKEGMRAFIEKRKAEYKGI